MKDAKKMQGLLGLALSESFEENLNSSSLIETKVELQQVHTNLCAGQMLNQYSIIKELGRGGMGVVYHAVDTKLNRQVAVKIIISQSKENSQKLLREAKSIARLNHPNIVQIFEICESPVYFFTMELIEGISLNKFIQEHSKKLKNKEYFQKITYIFIAIAKALDFAHEKKIIHRDVKPENIMLDAQLNPKIMDFGLAKIDQEQLSVTKELAGTPMYMSPEQARSLKITKATDIYSLGATLYESLAMRTIFQGDTIFNIMYQIIHDDPVRLRLLNPEIPIELEAICLKCLEKKINKRYVSMEILAKDLDNYLENKPIMAKPIGQFGIAKKFIMRNKLLSSTVLVIFLTTIIGFSIVYYSLLGRSAAIAERNIALEAEGLALQEKEAAIKKKEFISLKQNLYFANMNIENKKLKTVSDLLPTIRLSYQETNFGNPEDCIEFLWLQKKSKLYEKMKEVNGRKKIILVKDKFISYGETNGVIYLSSWDDNLQSEIKATTGCWNLSCSISPNQKYLAVLHADNKRYISLFNLNNLELIVKQEILPQGQSKNEESVCYFYSDEILIICGRHIIYVWELQNGRFEEIFSLESLGKGLMGNDILNRTISITADTNRGVIFFIHGTRLYFYSLLDKAIIKFISMVEMCICKYDSITDCLILGTTTGFLYFVDQKGNIAEFTSQHNSEVTKIVCENEYIYTSSKNGEIFLWDRKGVLEKTIYHIQNELTDFVVSHNIITCISQRVLYKYNLNTLDNPIVIEKNEDSSYVNLAGNIFSTANVYGKITIYDLEKKSIKNIVAYSKFVYSFVHPSNGKVLSIDKLGNVLLDNKELDQHYSKQGIFFENDPIKGIYNEEQDIFYLYNKKADVTLWDLANTKLLDEMSCPELQKDGSVMEASLDNNNHYMAFVFRYDVNNTKCIYALDLKNKKYHKIPMLYYGDNVHLKLSIINGVNSMVLSFEENIQIWDFDKLLKGEHSYYTLKKYTDYITCFTLAQDNTRLISIDKVGRIIIWNIGDNSLESETTLTSNRLLLEIKTNHNIKDCAYVPSLQKLITVGKDILVWDFK